MFPQWAWRIGRVGWSLNDGTVRGGGDRLRGVGVDGVVSDGGGGRAGVAWLWVWRGEWWGGRAVRLEDVAAREGEHEGCGQGKEDEGPAHGGLRGVWEDERGVVGGAGS